MSEHGQNSPDPIARGTYVNPAKKTRTVGGQNCPPLFGTRHVNSLCASHQNRRTQRARSRPEPRLSRSLIIRNQVTRRKVQAQRLLFDVSHLVKCVFTNRQLRSPAREILDYLARRPEAQDTIEGILEWWVLDSCIRSWAPTIAKTVAKLVEQGFLVKKPSPDGKTFYHLSRRYLSTLKQQQAIPKQLRSEGQDFSASSAPPGKTSKPK